MAEQVKSVIVPYEVSSGFISGRQVIDDPDVYRSGVLVDPHGSLAQPTAACYRFLTRVAPERKAMPLTVKQIEAATFGRSKERLGDGSGLFLRLYPSGSKIFQVLLPAEAGVPRRVWVSVGDFPATSLKEARERASWARL